MASKPLCPLSHGVRPLLPSLYQRPAMVVADLPAPCCCSPCLDEKQPSALPVHGVEQQLPFPGDILLAVVHGAPANLPVHGHKSLRPSCAAPLLHPSPSAPSLPWPSSSSARLPLLLFPLRSSKKPLLAVLASNFAAQRCRSKTAAPNPLHRVLARSAQPQHRRRSPRRGTPCVAWRRQVVQRSSDARSDAQIGIAIVLTNTDWVCLW
eukprot:XP_020396839.1 uncharacterized protein LOC100276852 isoform X2 [Zea mays]